MKLDYMQFLDLEIFTRFGAKLDVAMQKQIKRGKILREILKQDTLSPLPIEFQLAWLIAYNDGLLDEVKIEEIPSILSVIQEEIRNIDLTLSSNREQWVDTVKAWLIKVPHEQTH
jgi:F-type H+-transporting ATPase subunit alpha